MNKKLLRKSVILILVLTSFCCQIVSSQTEQKQILSTWFNSKKIAEKVWVIDDHGADYFYLVEGKDSALLIDNGLGVANVRDYVSSLTKLPLIVVNTHGHPDHAGANYQFPIVYAGLSDIEQINNLNNPKQLRNRNKDSQVPKDILFEDTINLKPTLMRSVEEGYVFNLGERQIEVIHVPGHTSGSICLLDRKNKLLFSGDNNNTIAWLFLENCEPLEVYLQSLKKLNRMNDAFNTLFPGHGEPLDKTFIEEEVKCVESILEGSCQPVSYESFAGNAQLCTYKRSKVAYNLDNLRRK